MIVVRDIFQLQIGKAKEAVALGKEAMALDQRLGGGPARILTDLVGDYYTFVMETEYDSLSDFDAAMTEAFQDPEWKQWYARFAPLIREGRREIFTVVERG